MPKTLAALDNTLLAIFAASIIAPNVLQAYGFDIRFAWMPMIFYASWVLFTGYYRPARTFSDSLERSTIERIRGWSYLVMLAITLVLNGLAVYFLPGNISYIMVVGVVVSLILFVAVISIPSRLFRKEIVCMERKDARQIMLMLKEIGSAAIQFSIAILVANFELVSSTSITELVLVILTSAALLAYGFYRNWKSSKIAHEIAVSLINSKWRKKYEKK